MYVFFSESYVCPGWLYVLSKVPQVALSLKTTTHLHILLCFWKHHCSPYALQSPDQIQSQKKIRQRALSQTKGWCNGNGILTLSACGTQNPAFCFNWTNMSWASKTETYYLILGKWLNRSVSSFIKQNILNVFVGDAEDLVRYFLHCSWSSVMLMLGQYC